MRCCKAGLEAILRKSDTIYVGASFPDATVNSGELRDIIIGNAKGGSLIAFIPDAVDLEKADVAETSVSGIAADKASVRTCSGSALQLQPRIRLYKPGA